MNELLIFNPVENFVTKPLLNNVAKELIKKKEKFLIFDGYLQKDLDYLVQNKDSRIYSLFILLIIFITNFGEKPKACEETCY